MSSPKVSVIIPNYNHAPYLRERINSVLSQTLTDFEIILLDDNSGDGSRAIMEEFRQEPAVSHIIYNEQNSGNTFVQWQLGFSLAQGEYIWIAESDDVAEPEFLETLVGALDSHPKAMVAYAHSRMIDSEGAALPFSWHPRGSSGKIVVYDGQWFNRHRMLVHNHIYNASMAVFRKSALQGVLQDYQAYRYCGDWLFWAYVCEQGEVIEVQRVLNRYRQHQQKVTAASQSDGRKWRDNANIIRHFIVLFQLSSLRQRCLRGRWTKRFRQENGSVLPAIRKEFADLYDGNLLDLVLYECGKVWMG